MLITSNNVHVSDPYHLEEYCKCYTPIGIHRDIYIYIEVGAGSQIQDGFMNVIIISWGVSLEAGQAETWILYHALNEEGWKAKSILINP